MEYKDECEYVACLDEKQYEQFKNMFKLSEEKQQAVDRVNELMQEFSQILKPFITPVTELCQWNEVRSSIGEIPNINKIHYFLKIEKEGTPFPIGSVVIAWSITGLFTFPELRPQVCNDNTWLLENLLKDYPEWDTEPAELNKFGTVLVNEEEVVNALKKSNRKKSSRSY